MNFTQFAQAENEARQALINKTAELIMASPTRHRHLTTERVIEALSEMDADELTKTHNEYSHQHNSKKDAAKGTPELAQAEPEHLSDITKYEHENTAYHGSNDSITSIDFGESRHFGFHIGTKKQAEMFGDKLHKVTFKYNKLLRLEDLGTWSVNSIIMSLKKLGYMDDATATPIYDEQDLAKQDEMLREAIVKAGFDAIVYRNQVENKGTDSYIIITEKTVASIKEVTKKTPSPRI